MQRETPFISKKHCPKATNPPNAEIDAVLLEQAKSHIESECRIMELYAKSAQARNEEVKNQLSQLILTLSVDAKTKEAISRQWNDDILKGETVELRK